MPFVKIMVTVGEHNIWLDSPIFLWAVLFLPNKLSIGYLLLLLCSTKLRSFCPFSLFHKTTYYFCYEFRRLYLLQGLPQNSFRSTVS